MPGTGEASPAAARSIPSRREKGDNMREVSRVGTKKPGITRRNFVALTSAAAVTAALGSGCAKSNDPAAKPEPEPAASDGPFAGAEIKRFGCGAWNCTGTCGHNVWVKDNAILKVEPADMGDEYYQRNICLKGITYAMQQVTSADRIKYPMRRVGERGSGQFEQISWDEALDEIVAKFDEIQSKHGRTSIAGVVMTGNITTLMSGIPRRIINMFGGQWVGFIGLMSDGAQAYGFLTALGTSDVANGWDDMLANSNFFMTVGQNIPAVKNGYMRYVLDAQDRGMYYVALDPRLSRGASKADRWVPLRPGTDPALLLSMCQHIVANGLHDEAYVRDHTNAPILVRSDTGAMVTAADMGLGEEGYVGWSAGSDAPCVVAPGDDSELYGSHVLTIDGQSVQCDTAWKLLTDSLNASYTPAQAAAICDIDESVIKDIAERYATSGASAIRCGQGSTRYYDGHMTVISAVTLGLICGMVGKPGGGVSWESGAFDQFTGNVPVDWAAWQAPNPDVEIPDDIDGRAMYEKIQSKEIRALWCMQYGIGSQAPRGAKVFDEVLSNLDYFIVSDVFMNQGAKWADLVLPICSYYEQADGDMIAGYDAHKIIQRTKRIIEPLWESKSDFDIGQMLAEKVGLLEEWNAYGSTVEECMEWILENHPMESIANTDFTEWREKGVSRLNMEQPWVALKDLDFPTSTGRGHVYFEELAGVGQALPCFTEPIEGNRREVAKTYPLTMMTAHPFFTVHGQNVTSPWIREFIPEPHIDINPVDAAERGIADGDLVRVFNDRGSFKVKAFLNEGIKPGCTNCYQGWWPEHYAEGHHGDVGHYFDNPAQDAIMETNWAAYDSAVQIEKA